ncbi:MAG: class I SAM-dependent methyltransferase [Deltaproteobacteria bacterium]|nr:class I SAM-dependent methyltransferase [Deltaproteobacteria bacterium]
MFLRKLLAHPLTRGMAIDDPATTDLRRRIIREKGFLRRIYIEWYSLLGAALPSGEGDILELGSGGGFLSEVIPGVITSECFPCRGVQLVVDARALPFADAALRGIVMTDVFHHVPDPGRFLREAVRCLRPGGVVAMIEPWVTPWSSFVYANLHHEPFDPGVPDWTFPSSGPLSGANGAMPWVVFQRDRGRLAADFPALALRPIRPLMPLSYVMSGGVSLRSLAPGWSYRAFRFLEESLGRLNRRLAMFALITFERRA